MHLCPYCGGSIKGGSGVCSNCKETAVTSVADLRASAETVVFRSRRRQGGHSSLALPDPLLSPKNKTPS
jgi:hypothetical protein